MFALLCVKLATVPVMVKYSGFQQRTFTFDDKSYKGASLINAGVYYLSSHCLIGIKPESFGFESDFLSFRQPEHFIYCMSFDDLFNDIDIPSDLQRAEVELRTLEWS